MPWRARSVRSSSRTSSVLSKRLSIGTPGVPRCSSQRRRLQRLFFVVAGNTELFGVGIDEDTALIVRGHVGEVVGAGGVTFVDGRDTVRFENADDLEAGRQLTLSHLRVGIVGSRYHLDLRERDLHELVVGETSRHRRRA